MIRLTIENAANFISKPKFVEAAYNKLMRLERLPYAAPQNQKLG